MWSPCCNAPRKEDESDSKLRLKKLEEVHADSAYFVHQHTGCSAENTAPWNIQQTYTCCTDARAGICTDGHTGHRGRNTGRPADKHTHRLAKVIWTPDLIYTESTEWQDSARIAYITPLFTFGVCAQRCCHKGPLQPCFQHMEPQAHSPRGGSPNHANGSLFFSIC